MRARARGSIAFGDFRVRARLVIQFHRIFPRRNFFLLQRPFFFVKRVAELILVSFRFGKVRTGQINFITIAQRFGWAVDLTNDARARLLSHTMNGVVSAFVCVSHGIILWRINI